MEYFAYGVISGALVVIAFCCYQMTKHIIDIKWHLYSIKESLDKYTKWGK